MAAKWSVEVVGESHYQEAISDLVRRHGRDNLKGELVPDPKNPYDANAVKVVLNGKHVGHLNREMAANFALARNPPRRVYGRVIGGTPGKPSYGVMLDVSEALYDLLNAGSEDDEEDGDPEPPRGATPIIETAAPAAAAPAPPVFIVQNSGPGMLIRVLWFLFVGWWLGALVSGLAWVLNVTIIGLPVGLWLINRLPGVITLRPQEQQYRLVEGNVLVRGKAQHGFLLRAAYFLLVGWWFSGLWMGAAYVLVLLLLTIPIAFWMFGRVGAVTTLYRS